jgi:peptide/nickel transport system substrate-binding protein
MIQVLTEEHDFEMALFGFNWNATFIQDAMFSCNQYEGGFNIMKYCNPEIDEIFAQAVRTFDETERIALMTEAGNIINDELPVAVMHFSKANIGYSDRLQNFKPNSWGVDTSYVWIQQ